MKVGTKFTLTVVNPDAAVDPRIPVDERQNTIIKTGTVLAEHDGMLVVQLDDGTKPFAIPPSVLEKK